MSMTQTHHPQKQLIGAGHRGDVWRLQAGMVIKLFRSHIDDCEAQREHAAASLAYRAGIPTPRPLQIFRQDGQSGVIFDEVTGPDLTSALAQKPFSILQGARRFACLHHQIHAIRFADGPDQMAIRAEQVVQLSLDALGCRTAMLDRIASLSVGESLCHGDFHPGNVLMRGDDMVAIDWGGAAAGDPLADVAHTLILLNAGALPDGAGAITRSLVRIFRKRFSAAYLAEYARLSGAASVGAFRKALAPWIAPLAAARLGYQATGEADALMQLIRRYDVADTPVAGAG